MKPGVETPRYVHIDRKPLVCIRARLRLGVALTPARKHIYGLQVNANCDCGGIGDTEHVLLWCPKFAADRNVCSDSLQREPYFPVELTLPLLLGDAPPTPEGNLRCEKTFLRLQHDLVLGITGTFLLAIDRRIHL